MPPKKCISNTKKVEYNPSDYAHPLCDMPRKLLLSQLAANEVRNGIYICRACTWPVNAHEDDTEEATDATAELVALTQQKTAIELEPWKGVHLQAQKTAKTLAGADALAVAEKQLGELVKRNAVSPEQLIHTSFLLFHHLLTEEERVFFTASCVRAAQHGDYQSTMVRAHNLIWSQRRGGSYLAANGEHIFHPVYPTRFPIMPAWRTSVHQ